MDIYRKILILIIILIFTYIIARLLHRRRVIQKMIKDQEQTNMMEGFNSCPTATPPSPSLWSLFTSSVSATPQNIEFSKLISNRFYQTPSQVSGIPSNQQYMPLSQCCIKAAYNAAYTGTYVNVDMIEFLLGRGCRFLDFEVYSQNSKPVVAVSSDPSFTTMDSKNSIILDNALSTVVGKAFSSSAPNSGDPVFIQLRIRASAANLPALYNMVTRSIQNTLMTKIYQNVTTGNAIAISGATPLSQIMGKVIVVVDTSLDSGLSQCSSPCTLSNYVNIKSASSSWLTGYSAFYAPTPPSGPSTPITVSSSDIRLISCTPQASSATCSGINAGTTCGLNLYSPSQSGMVNQLPTTNTTNLLGLVKTFGVQTVQMMYFIPDVNIFNYEGFFNNFGTAFVPMGYALTYG